MLTVHAHNIIWVDECGDRDFRYLSRTNLINWIFFSFKKRVKLTAI